MKIAAMPFMGHLEELRNRLIKSLIAVGLGTLVAFTFSDQLLALLAHPYEVAQPGESLVYFRPTEAFSLVMRISLFGGKFRSGSAVRLILR